MTLRNYTFYTFLPAMLGAMYCDRKESPLYARQSGLLVSGVIVLVDQYLTACGAGSRLDL
jgi:hypothetical protein